MIHTLFIMGDTGDVMFEKHWMGKTVERSICDWFWGQVRKAGSPKEVPPVLASPLYYLLHIVREGITFLACTQEEMPVLLGIEFLSRVADALTEYLGGLNEDTLKDNFVTVYELLDEMMESGLPLTTEPNVLRELVTPPNLVNRMVNALAGLGPSSVGTSLPAAAASSVPWRAAGVQHSKNEIYFDIVEELDATVSREGTLLHCEAYGEIMATSRLSGMPDVLLKLGPPNLFSDVRFHPCIRLKTWEKDRVLSFIPPDGPFKLLSYRVRGLTTPLLSVKPQISYSNGSGRVNVLVSEKSVPDNRSLEGITVKMPLPRAVVHANLTANVGTVHWDASSRVCVWNVGRIPKDKAPCLSGSLQVEPGLEKPEDAPSLLLGFKVMGLAISGARIEGMSVQHEAYKPHRGVRAWTEAGSYEIRFS